MKHIHF